jgi:hypothetical protein
MLETYGGKNAMGSGQIGSNVLGSGLFGELPVQFDEPCDMLPAVPMEN